MPIANHTVEIGGGHAVVRAFDQDGKEYMFSFFTAGVVDVNALVTQKIAALDVSLAETEFEQIVGSV